MALLDSQETEAPRDDRRVRYKVVELTVVTDAEIEARINEIVAAGWQFDSMHFAMWEGSKRPSMAFLMFVRRWEEKGH